MTRVSQARLGPRKRPQQARSRETMDAIVRAAARVFVTHGYARGTTNRIAEKAGVSVGSLYEYFPNKDAILVALVEDHLAEAEALMSALVAQGPAPDVRALVRRFVSAMVRLHARDPNLHRVIFEEAPLPKRLRRRLAEVEEGAALALEALLRAPGAEGAPTDRDPALAARVLVKVVEALTHDFVLHPAGLGEEERYVEEVTELVARYLGGGR